MPPLHSLTAFALLGVMLGAVGWLFNASIFRSQDLWAKLSPTGRLAACMSVGAGIGGLAILLPDLTSGGYGAIQDAMSGRIPELGLLLLFAARFGLTVLCFSTGVPGGIFAPMVALGTIAGLWFAGLVSESFPAAQVSPGVFMIAGAGALFSATVRAPLTGIVLAAELTGNFQLTVPVAIACVSATLVAHALGGRPIYTVLLERQMEAEGR